MASIHIEDFEDVGRAYVSKNTFTIGEIIAEEAPLLDAPTSRIVTKQNVRIELAIRRQLMDAGTPLTPQQESELRLFLQVNLLASYLDLPSGARTVIQDFARPLAGSNDVARTLEQITLAVATLQEFSEFSVDQLSHFLLVMATNAYEFIVGAQAHVGLFSIGSKLAHSCSANFIQTQTLSQYRDGKLHFLALKEIPAGSLLTINYYSSDSHRALSPRSDRRAYLSRTKFFHCRCDRCNGEDDLRILRCPNCANESLFQSPSEDVWHCDYCAKEFNAKDEHLNTLLESEARLSQDVVLLTSIFDEMQTSVFGQAYEEMSTTREECLKELGSEHWTGNWLAGFLAVRAFQEAMAGGREPSVRKRARRDEARKLARGWLKWSARIANHAPHIYARYVKSFAPMLMVEKKGGKSIFETDEDKALVSTARKWLVAEFVGTSNSGVLIQATK
ncbi:hypothetical protein BJ742DRAFT_870348 [Cladochytrium replicatum]|nr:hypothetical protein BJ742DRAFT_870348 [Cladochytrium replicatum]